jgi:protein-S-isoprenylcysteine O-methyltransferase Ste14
MRQFTKWASREYAFAPRLLVTLFAGILFVLLIPYTLIYYVPQLDSLFSLPSLFYGIANYILGIFLVGVGATYGFWSIISQLNRAGGTPLPMMATQTLLVSGPFKQCRNPMTFGTILLYFGIGILIGSISSMIIVIVFAALLLTYIKLVEERELATRFGQEYLVYKAATPFIIPKIFTQKRLGS